MWRDLTHTGTERLMEVRALRDNQALSQEFTKQVLADAKAAAQRHAETTGSTTSEGTGETNAAASGSSSNNGSGSSTANSSNAGSGSSSVVLDLPTDRDIENARAIIEWCLRADPSERPTARELLKSSLVPKRVESEDVDQALEAALEPTSSHFRTVITKLMERKSTDYDDMLYNFLKQSKKSPIDFPVAAQTRELVYRSLRTTIERHSGVFMPSPLLTPHSSLLPRHPQLKSTSLPTLMDPSGNVVTLPFSLTIPFVRFVAQSQPRESLFEYTFDTQRKVHTDIRRYDIGNVSSWHRSGGRSVLKTKLECCFDIVWRAAENETKVPSQKSAALTAEAMRALTDVLSEYAIPSYCVHVSHTNFLHLFIEAFVAELIRCLEPPSLTSSSNPNAPTTTATSALGMMTSLGPSSTNASIRPSVSFPPLPSPNIPNVPTGAAATTTTATTSTSTTAPHTPAWTSPTASMLPSTSGKDTSATPGAPSAFSLSAKGSPETDHAHPQETTTSASPESTANASTAVTSSTTPSKGVSFNLSAIPSLPPASTKNLLPSLNAATHVPASASTLTAGQLYGPGTGLIIAGSVLGGSAPPQAVLETNLRRGLAERILSDPTKKPKFEAGLRQYLREFASVFVQLHRKAHRRSKASALTITDPEDVSVQSFSSMLTYSDKVSTAGRKMKGKVDGVELILLPPRIIEIFSTALTLMSQSSSQSHVDKALNKLHQLFLALRPSPSLAVSFAHTSDELKSIFNMLRTLQVTFRFNAGLLHRPILAGKSTLPPYIGYLHASHLACFVISFTTSVLDYQYFILMIRLLQGCFNPHV